MSTETGERQSSQAVVVEIYVPRGRVGAAASGESESRLSDEDIAALQQTIGSLIAGFRPPEPREEGAGLRFETLEIEVGFKITTGSGSVLKLLLDASAEASIKVKAVWNKGK